MACTENTLLRSIHIIFPNLKIRNKQDAIEHFKLSSFTYEQLKAPLVSKLASYDSKFVGNIYNISKHADNTCLKQLIAEAFALSVKKEFAPPEKPQSPKAVHTEVDKAALPVIKKGELYYLNDETFLEFFIRTADRMPDFEARHEQLIMMEEVVAAINNRQFLIVEAGTGVGKSLAYLFPMVIWALANDEERVVISTNTKNLQDQLIKKDIPLIQKLLGVNFIFSRLKGRSNYICLRRFNNYIKTDEWRESADAEALINLLIWLRDTDSGELEENYGFFQEFTDFYILRDEIVSKSYYCTYKECKFYNDCFVYKARNLARKSKVVVINHSLLFSDVDVDRSILPNFSTIVLDEAHKIEERATEALSIEFSYPSIARVFRRLYRIRRKTKKETGLLMNLFFEINKIKDRISENTAKEIFKLIRAVNGGLTQTLDEIKVTLQEYGNNVFKSRDYGTRIRITKIPGSDSKIFIDSFKRIGLNLRSIITTLKSLLDLIDRVPEYISPEIDNHKKDLAGAKEEVQTIYNNYYFIFEEFNRDYVYWIEKIGRENYGIFAAPIDIADYLADNFYNRLETAVFCSATLTVNKDFDFFYKGIGLDKVIGKKEIILGSPFNYSANVMVGVSNFIPAPNEDGYSEKLHHLLAEIVSYYQGRTLILFTNFGLMRQARDELKEKHHSLNIFAQRLDGTTYALIEEFKTRDDVVLMGVDSYWEGIDVPGEALSFLVITRLPFGTPDDPILQAKRELVEKRGGKPFFDFDLPRAVIRLKQGFGRLIRKQTDKGAVLILDKRILTARYSHKFWQSLPEVEITPINSHAAFVQFLKDTRYIYAI